VETPFGRPNIPIIDQGIKADARPCIRFAASTARGLTRRSDMHFAESTTGVVGDRRASCPQRGSICNTDHEDMDSDIRGLLKEYDGQFLRFIAVRTGDQDEAEDVLQDFYVRVLTKEQQIRVSEAMLGWLYAVLRSVLADHYRRKATRRRAVQEVRNIQATTSGLQWPYDPAVLETKRRACRCYLKVLPSLKPEYEEALRRVYLEDESRAEAACSMGITVGNLRVRLHRSRRALRQALAQSCSDCKRHHCLGENGTIPL